ncbi:MAG: glycosyltransferase family 25 protein [Bacteroidota bacterium]|nr:glycosyltransferase family 25 protein [Bacteroidota bacterium]
MKVFLVASTVYEAERLQNVVQLKRMFNDLELIEAVYPAFEKIPFKEKLIEQSFRKTGRTLRAGELGCLLSHRRVWSIIKNMDVGNDVGFLILESDSRLHDLDILTSYFSEVHKQYDIFFWGAFDGRMQLLRSKKQKIVKNYSVGKPLLNSVYCTYGYSINRKVAIFLFDQTKQVDYPCDYWKYRLSESGLSVGGISPCLVETDESFGSMIQAENSFSFLYRLRDSIVDCKNKIIGNLS